MPLVAHERVDEQLQADGERERLVRLLTAEGDELVLRREPGDDVAPGDRAHRDVGDDRLAVAARDPDRKRIRAGELRPAFGMAEPRRRGRGQDADEPAVGEPADVVPEHPGRERPLADDEARVRGRPLELRAYDSPEDEIADRAASVPALEALGRPRAASARRPRRSPRAPRATGSARGRVPACRVARLRRSEPTAPARRPPRSRARAAGPGPRQRPRALVASRAATPAAPAATSAGGTRRRACG